VQQPEDAAAAEVFRDAPEDSAGASPGAAGDGSDSEEEVFRDIEDSDEEDQDAEAAAAAVGGKQKQQQKQRKQKQGQGQQANGTAAAAAAAAAGGGAGQAGAVPAAGGEVEGLRAALAALQEQHVATCGDLQHQLQVWARGGGGGEVTVDKKGLGLGVETWQDMSPPVWACWLAS
jgi:hypothetical protein